MSEIIKQESAPIQKQGVREWIDSPKFIEQVKRSLPEHIKPDFFIRSVLTATIKNPKILECTQASVFKCLFDCAASGLVPDNRQAHIIPYGTTATLIVDYKGLVELALRSGTIESIHADVVCENDVFSVNAGELIEHSIQYRKPRGNVYAVYCLIRMKGGGQKLEVMTKEEVESIRKRSKSGENGPWKTDYNEMAKKTVTRRAMKWVSLSPEIREAVEREEDFKAEIKREQPSFKALVDTTQAEIITNEKE